KRWQKTPFPPLNVFSTWDFSGLATRPVSIQTMYGHSHCRHFVCCSNASAAASLTLMFRF
ncbi:hypothetical protein TRIATDRAFT_258596, partial [Trichoderma atroviride IMI 206040]